MSFPLNFWDIALWLAVTAIILLVTSELLSPYYGQTNIIVNRKMLRAASLIMGLLFLLVALTNVYRMIA